MSDGVAEIARRPHRLRITANGRAVYEVEWARYRELYPDAEPSEPAR